MPGKAQTVSNNVTTLQKEDPLCVKWNFKPYNTNFTASVAFWLAVWLSGNALASINVVALHQTRLVLGWVTVCGRVNHFGR